MNGNKPSQEFPWVVQMHLRSIDAWMNWSACRYLMDGQAELARGRAHWPFPQWRLIHISELPPPEPAVEQPPAVGSPVFSKAVAAALLDVSTDRIDSLIADGELTTITVGRRKMITRLSLAAAYRARFDRDPPPMGGTDQPPRRRRRRSTPNE